MSNYGNPWGADVNIPAAPPPPILRGTDSWVNSSRDQSSGLDQGTVGGGAVRAGGGQHHPVNSYIHGSNPQYRQAQPSHYSQQSSLQPMQRTSYDTVMSRYQAAGPPISSLYQPVPTASSSLRPLPSHAHGMGEREPERLLYGGNPVQPTMQYAESNSLHHLSEVARYTLYIRGDHI